MAQVAAVLLHNVLVTAAGVTSAVVEQLAQQACSAPEAVFDVRSERRSGPFAVTACWQHKLHANEHMHQEGLAVVGMTVILLQ